jgi:hypothetical protein
LAEDALDPGGERLAFVDDAEQSLLEAKPSIHEVGQEVLDDRGVLGVAFPDPGRDRGPIGRDQQRDDTAALVEDDAVDHEHRGVMTRQVRAEQLGQLLLGGGDEAPRDHRRGVAASDDLEIFSDGFSNKRMAPRGNPSEHALDSDLGEQVPVTEKRVGAELHLSA